METDRRKPSGRRGGRLVATHLNARLAERLDRAEAKLHVRASDILRVGLLRLLDDLDAAGELTVKAGDGAALKLAS